jgi:LysR family transcriptional regulator, glycine cleavage system transcriptional activator
MRRLPPLDTLRVFEAAARLKSFKEAGDELNVTASAVSHRVAALEEELATPLFVRHTRRIEVTPQGERLAAGVRRGLAEIRRAVTSVDRREGTNIRISGIPSHVTRWLAPRLHRFRVAHPEIELHITADLALVDLTQRTFDVALRFGNGVYPGVRAEYLMDDAIFPVASPRYIAEAGPIAQPADILLLARILDVTAEDDESGTNWRTWFAHHRLPMDSVERGMQFNGAAIALEAAAGGLGIAIARRSLVGKKSAVAASSKSSPARSSRIGATTLWHCRTWRTGHPCARSSTGFAARRAIAERLQGGVRERHRRQCPQWILPRILARAASARSVRLGLPCAPHVSMRSAISRRKTGPGSVTAGYSPSLMAQSIASSSGCRTILNIAV